MSHEISKAERRSLNQSFLATTLVFLLTSFHHYYGAIVFDTAWRTHILFYGGTILLICFLFMFLYTLNRKKVFRWLYVILGLLFFGLVIGLFEGFYNHLVKDILFFSGMELETWRRFFPAPTYEIPNDLIFEATGILQFFMVLVQIYYVRKTFRYNSNPQSARSKELNPSRS